jgi:endonuclease I
VKGCFFVCQSNYLEISRAALRRNAAAVRDAVQVPVIAILKCDGYGVSICEAAAAWQAEGITMLAFPDRKKRWNCGKPDSMRRFCCCVPWWMFGRWRRCWKTM